MSVVERTIKAAWEGRISGCLLGKPVEIISMREGREGLSKYLSESGSLPLRNYVRPSHAALIVCSTTDIFTLQSQLLSCLIQNLIIFNLVQ